MEEPWLVLEGGRAKKKKPLSWSLLACFATAEQLLIGFLPSGVNSPFTLQAMPFDYVELSICA